VNKFLVSIRWELFDSPHEISYQVLTLCKKFPSKLTLLSGSRVEGQARSGMLLERQTDTSRARQTDG